MPFNSEYVQQELNAGVKAHKAGAQTAAWLHFQAALREDTQNITALLWLAYLADGYEKRVFLLKRVLEIEPDNQRAQAGLKWAESESRKETAPQPQPAQAEAQTAAEGKTSEDVFGLNQRLKKAIDTNELKEQAKKGPIAQRARRRIGPLIFLLALGLSAAGMAMVPSSWFNPGVSLAALSPQKSGETGDSSAWVVMTVATPPPLLLPALADIPLPTATLLPPAPLPIVVAPTATSAPLAYPPALPDEKWIEVILDEQKVVAWEGEKAVRSFIASTGLAGTPTRVGRFRIYQKYLATRMTGPGYDLPDVPHTMYYDRGYALHGAYWHSNFGQPMSHGCINLSATDAEWLFAWAGPVMPEGGRQIAATQDNPGTLVVVHP